MVRITRSQKLSTADDEATLHRTPQKKEQTQSYTNKLINPNNSQKKACAVIKKKYESSAFTMNSDEKSNLKASKSNIIKINGSDDNLPGKLKVNPIEARTCDEYIKCIHTDKNSSHGSSINNKIKDCKVLIERTKNPSKKQSPVAFHTSQKRDSSLNKNLNCNGDIKKNAISKECTVDGDEDSFLNHITSRSPIKRNARAENPFEALDQLEKAFEVLQEISKFEVMLEQDSPQKPSKKVALDTRNLKSRQLCQPNKIYRPGSESKTSTSTKENITFLPTPKEKISPEVPLNHKPANFNKHNPVIKVNNTVCSFDLKMPAKTSKIPSNLSRSPLGPNKNKFYKTDIPTSSIKRINSVAKPSTPNPRCDVFTRLSTVTSKHRSSNSHQINELKVKETKTKQIFKAPSSTKQKSSTPSRSVSSPFKNGDRGVQRTLKFKPSRRCLNDERTSSPGVNPNIQNPTDKLFKEGNGVYTSKPGHALRDVKEPHSSNIPVIKDKHTNGFMNAAILARLEAAERGRQTIEDWAKMKIASKAGAVIT